MGTIYNKGNIYNGDDEADPYILDTLTKIQKQINKSTAENLLQYPYVNTTLTDKGVTFTDIGDSTITASGVAANGNATFLLNNGNLPTSGEYVISGSEGGVSTTYFIAITNSSGIIAKYNEAPVISANGDSIKFDIANLKDNNGNKINPSTLKMSIIINNGHQANGKLFKPMLRLASRDNNDLLTNAEITNILNFDNAGSHNCLYRGKLLGTSFTPEQQLAILKGTFEDMYIGDYWVINNIVYIIAAFDYWLYTGAGQQCTKHHAVIVPYFCMIKSAPLDSETTTDKGYTGIGFYSGTNADGTSNTARAECRNIIQAAFGESHILIHRELFSTSAEEGKPTGDNWFDTDIDLMNEIMVYGHSCFAVNSNDGTNIPYNYTIDKTQLPLFRIKPDSITIRQHYWLRDIASSTRFARVNTYGISDHNHIFNGSGTGIRPVFGIC